MKKQVQNKRTLFAQSHTASLQQNQDPLRTNASFIIIKERNSYASEGNTILLGRFKPFNLNTKSQTYTSLAPEKCKESIRKVRGRTVYD